MPRKLFRHFHNHLKRRRRSVKRRARFERLESRSLMAVAPELLSDINTGTLPADPYGFTELHGEVYFFATDKASAGDYAQRPEPLPQPIHDSPQPLMPIFIEPAVRDVDLWKSDGTAEGTVRVKDLPPSRAYPEQLVRAGDLLYFSAFTDVTGVELWKCDGTTAGTVLVEDIRPGSETSSVWNLAAAGNQVVFVADDGVHGWELWKSDGTAAGTALVRDLIIGPAYSYISPFHVAGTQVFFTANDGVHGVELWKSDGTESGTVLIRDMLAGPAGGGVYPLAVVGAELYFRSYDEEHRDSLWRTDGTEAGTVLVTDDIDRAIDFESFRSHLYFAKPSNDSGDELWRSDGTPEGTIQLETLSPGTATNIRWLTTVGDQLFFIKWDAHSSMELWVTHGERGGAVQLHTFSGMVQQVVGTAQHVFVTVYRSDGLGVELWASDGTKNGTLRAGHFTRLQESSWSRPTIVGIDDRLFFAAADVPHGSELWLSRGTRETTSLVTDINTVNASSRPFGFVQTQGQLYFFAYDARASLGLYRTDGTTAGLRRLADVSSAHAVALGRQLIFTGPYDARGWLWITDGTAAGTRRIESAQLEGTYGLENFTRVGNMVFVTGDNRGPGLWKTDGTAEGTVLVRAGIDALNLTAVGSKLFFLARGEVDYDLWVTDGTQAGTRRVHAITPEPVGPDQFHLFRGYVQPGSMTALGDKLLISRKGSRTGEELWISDGTPEGTRLLKDLVPGLAGSSPRLMTRVGDTVYFVAGGWSGGFALEGAPSDVGLWKTDGTARGTRLIKSFANWSGPSHLTAVGDQLFFVGGDRQNGYGLWRTDGTQRGTRLLLSWELSSVIVFPTDGETFIGPKIGWLTDVRSELYFQFDDGRHGPELWRSDGTVAGTWMVTDQRPGPQGATPTNLTPFRGRLFYAAHDEAVGVELFTLDTRGVSRTVTGSARGETWNVIRRGDRLEVRSGGERIFSARLDSISELVLDTRGGNDFVIVDAGDRDLGARLRIEAGRGNNLLWIKSGTANVRGGAERGRLQVYVAADATLVTRGFDARRVRIFGPGRVLFDLEGLPLEPTSTPFFVEPHRGRRLLSGTPLGRFVSTVSRI
jgi:ELWxxDGT repeat protein